jgi:hypothetical protein
VPVATTTFHSGWSALLGIALWCVPGLFIIFARWGTAALVEALPLQLAILLMLGVAFSGDPAER